MRFELYTDALARNLPEHRLRRGDVVKVVDHHPFAKWRERVFDRGLQRARRRHRCNSRARIRAGSFEQRRSPQRATVNRRTVI